MTIIDNKAKCAELKKPLEYEYIGNEKAFEDYIFENVLQARINAPVRPALIDNKIYYRTFCAFVGNSLPITLIEFQNDRIFVPYNAWG